MLNPKFNTLAHLTLDDLKRSVGTGIGVGAVYAVQQQNPALGLVLGAASGVLVLALAADSAATAPDAAGIGKEKAGHLA